ncbi:RHTO0S01e01904g1_1 [Rhodotorula toruloides]|uniref:RHTO0S01e01904g1_1 n=1 Tax=Rhodotorula toruloides TaxID=5286 RepID=A0A061ADF9_RHOTO|nr:RHTO0S01e01904g1_1 [Rhodotorula toruloides]
MAQPVLPAPQTALQDPATSWQVVLVDPSKRKVVLYSPHLRRLAVSETPPGSPLATPPRRGRFGRSGGRSWASVSTGSIGSDGEERAGRAVSPLREPASPSLSTVSDATDDVRITGPPPSHCPLCYQPLPPPAQRRRPSPSSHETTRTRHFPLLPPPASSTSTDDSRQGEDGLVTTQLTNVRDVREVDSNWWGMLSEASSLVATPMSTASRALPSDDEGDSASGQSGAEHLDQSQMNEGYFARFFEEVQLLGKGGQGAVYLVRHVLNGEALGLYACKKISVGDSPSYLLSILREVHLLESVSHPNIVAYHHAWLETSSAIPSRFAPQVPTLHILMSYANGGSLAEFIEARRGSRDESARGSVGERARHRRQEEKERAVHLLRLEDIVTLFEDIVRGLAFLHSKNILHLDLKAENVLLNWDEDALLPTCQLSDFGSATNDSYHRERHGGSGTLAYTPPEAFTPSPTTGALPSPDRGSDMWALGLILHLLCFFSLPFGEAREEGDTRKLEEEVRSYKGFNPSDPLPLSASARHDLPTSLLHLLSQLVNLDSTRRPSCEKVQLALTRIRRDLQLQRLRGEHEEAVGTAVAKWLPGTSKAGNLLPRAFIDARRRRLSEASSGVRWEEVEVEVESEAGSDEWNAPPSRASSALLRRASSPALFRRRSPSPLPSPPTPRPRLSPPLPLPAPPSATLPAGPSSSPLSAILDFGRKGTGVVRVGLREGSGSGMLQGTVLASLAAAVKLIHLRRLSPAISTFPAPDMSLDISPAIPLWLVSALVLETLIDVSLASPVVTAGLLVVHMAVLRLVARLG